MSIVDLYFKRQAGWEELGIEDPSWSESKTLAMGWKEIPVTYKSRTKNDAAGYPVVEVKFSYSDFGKEFNQEESEIISMNNPKNIDDQIRELIEWHMEVNENIHANDWQHDEGF